MEVLEVLTPITLDVKPTMVIQTIKIVTWMELAPTVLTMLAAKPWMVVLPLTNLVVILLHISALVVNRMQTAHLVQVIVMLMVLAEIAPNKEVMEQHVLVGLSLMDPLVQPPPIQTVILSLVSVLTSVCKMLTVPMPANLSANLSVVVVLNASEVVTVPYHNGEELRRL